MTREEAIENVKGILEEATQYENAVCYVTSVDEEPLKIAIADMEKKIPMKPKMEEDDFDYGEAYVCQVCGTFIAYETDILSGCCKFNYCTECGQALDWSE